MAFSPFKYFSEVRSEAEKVTWPSRKETLITSAMVVVMAVAASLFFLVADQAISRFVAFIIDLGA